MNKNRIKEYALDFPVDDIGFAKVDSYISKNSPAINSFFPEAKSIIVMAFNELNWMDSSSMEIAMNGRLDLMSHSRSCNYKLMKFLNRNFKAKTVSAPFSYPLKIDKETKFGLISVFSLRHAALAAGLGVFGRNNLILHPEFGSRVIFSAVLTDMEIEPDPPLKVDLCTNCNICVDNCPSKALETEGRTDMMKCLKTSQPYGMGGSMQFWHKFIESPKEEQKKMFMSPEFFRLYQAQSIGYQYFCFECIKNCPIGQ
jgi:epoxyqueuosine reductase